MKECAKCHRLLPESCFYVRRDNGRLQSHCIDCCKAHGRLRNGYTGIYRKDNTNLNNTIMSKIVAKVESITPEIAKEYLKFNNVNRPVNKKTVDFYAEQMSKGQWRINGEAICFTEDGCLANGQHRLNAILKYGKPINILVVRGCDKDSFITYDSGRNRSVSDVFSLSQIPNYSKVSSIVNKYFLFHYNLVAISKEGTNKCAAVKADKKKSKQDFLNEYNSSPNLYQKACKTAASCCDKIRLLTEAEVGGLYVYLVKDKFHSEDVVESFFRMLFFNENVSNMTITVLREKIIQDRMSNNTMTSRYKSALIAKTWNAYITDKEISRLSWNESKEGKITYL